MAKKKKSSSRKSSNKDTTYSPVRAKKALGQHFLTDETVCERIANTFKEVTSNVLEIGPGTGMLTKYFVGRALDVKVVDLDTESITYLNTHFTLTYASKISQTKSFKVLEQDVLKMDFKSLFQGSPFSIIGNFPYNISTQIVFKVIENRDLIPEFSGMFQKEVAQRICAGPGSKTYGILSVLTQAYYTAEYVFTVGSEVFNPPPKVDSGVLRLERKVNKELQCDEVLFFKVVKTVFNQRRKTLRNGIKSFGLSAEVLEDPLFKLRPEQLSVSDFEYITRLVFEAN